MSGHLFLEHISTQLQRVVISIRLEESSAAKIGLWRVHNLGTQGRMHSLKRKWFSIKSLVFLLLVFFSCIVSHCVSYMSEWVCPALLFWFHSLWWRFSNHFDAVLLELRSEQCVFIFQLFNLKPKKKKMHHPQHSPQQNTALTLLTKLFPLKNKSWLMYTQDYAIPEIREQCV